MRGLDQAYRGTRNGFEAALQRNLVINMHPSGTENISRPDLEDWCLELNNQMIGRVKNKLVGYGRILVVGLPVLLMGTGISGVAAPNSEVHQYAVESADGQIILTLATLVTPGFGDSNWKYHRTTRQCSSKAPFPYSDRIA